MPGIIKPQESTPAAFSPGLQMHRLGAGHVRPIAAQKHHTRPGAGGLMIGDAAALGCGQKLGHCPSTLTRGLAPGFGPVSPQLREKA